MRTEIDKVLERIGTLYLRSKKSDKSSNHDGDNISVLGSQNMQQSQRDHNPHDISVISNGEFRSKILDSLTTIEPFFEGRVIKSAKLLYRASEQNFSIKRFHELSDNVTDTLTIAHN